MQNVGHSCTHIQSLFAFVFDAAAANTALIGLLRFGEPSVRASASVCASAGGCPCSRASVRTASRVGRKAGRHRPPPRRACFLFLRRCCCCDGAATQEPSLERESARGREIEGKETEVGGYTVDWVAWLGVQCPNADPPQSGSEFGRDSPASAISRRRGLELESFYLARARRSMVDGCRLSASNDE